MFSFEIDAYYFSDCICFVCVLNKIECCKHTQVGRCDVLSSQPLHLAIKTPLQHTGDFYVRRPLKKSRPFIWTPETYTRVHKYISRIRMLLNVVDAVIALPLGGSVCVF